MQPVDLPGFLKSLGPLISRHGLVAVGGLVVLEDFGVPVPGETVLIAAAVYAGGGQLNIVAVAVVAFVAAVIGDNIGFTIGHFGGRPLVERYGKYILLRPETLARAEAFFERQGVKIIVVARFVEGLRQANGIIAGTTGMPWRRFLIFNALGAALWVGCWCAIGELAGSHIAAIYSAISRYALVACGVAIVVVVVLLLRRRRRRAASRAGVDPAAVDEPRD